MVLALCSMYNSSITSTRGEHHALVRRTHTLPTTKRDGSTRGEEETATTMMRVDHQSYRVQGWSTVKRRASTPSYLSGRVYQGTTVPYTLTLRTRRR